MDSQRVQWENKTQTGAAHRNFHNGRKIVEHPSLNRMTPLDALHIPVDTPGKISYKDAFMFVTLWQF
jgi:hypothetical protein